MGQLSPISWARMPCNPLRIARCVQALLISITFSLVLRDGMLHALPDTTQQLSGHYMVCRWHVQGQVLCLAAAMDYLFSGGQDTTIRVWKFNAATSKFDPAVKPWPSLSPVLFPGPLQGIAFLIVSPVQVLVRRQWSQSLQPCKTSIGAAIQQSSMNMGLWRTQLLSFPGAMQLCVALMAFRRLCKAQQWHAHLEAGDYANALLELDMAQDTEPEALRAAS